MDDQYQPEADGNRISARRRTTLTCAAAAALLSVGGLVGATFVKSPSQAAADTRPPAASVITAPVRSEVLRNTVVLRGTFSDGATVAAQPTSVAATSASPPGDGVSELVITGVFVHPGETVTAGHPLVEYSGRPVFALPGTVPVYRDLTPGESGKDVAQLQSALSSLGCSSYPDPAGAFAVGTEYAVRCLYRTMGYPVPLISTTPDGSAASSPQTGSKTATAAKDPTASAPVALPMVPASELLFVPSLPARVVSVPVSVGDPVKGPVVTLARGGPILTGMLDPSDSDLVKAGMAVQVMDDTTGLTAQGTVTSIGSLTTGSASGTGGDTSDSGAMAAGDADGGSTTGAYLPLAVTPTSSWPIAMDGQNVRLTITAAATSGAVLAVPEAAIFAGADSATTVTVRTPAGTERVVPVTPGASADGMVQITPRNGSLSAGDTVVVGQ